LLQAQIPQRRSWASAGWLVVFVCAALLAAINIHAGILLVMLAMLGATAAMFVQAHVSRSGTLPKQSTMARYVRPTMLQRVVYTPGGTARQGIVVPVRGVDGYTTVLTTDGYKLVNDRGQIVYSLER